MSRLLLVALISAAALLAASCSGETSEGSSPPMSTTTATATSAATSPPTPSTTPDDTAPAVAHVVASDGTTTLAISESALPPGASLDDVRITARMAEEIKTPEGAVAPVASIVMEPDGLVLNEPAFLSVELPIESATSPLSVLHVSGDQVELITDLALEFDPAGEFVTVTFPVEHFSQARVYSSRAHFTVEVTEPEQRVIGDSFEVRVTVTANREPIEVSWAYDIIEPGVYGSFGPLGPPSRTYEMTDSDWTISGTMNASGPLEPALREDAPPPTLLYGDTYTADITLTCARSGYGRYYYAPKMEFERLETSIDDGQPTYDWGGPKPATATAAAFGAVSCGIPAIEASAWPPITTYTLSPPLTGPFNFIEYDWWGWDCGSATGQGIPQLVWKHGDDESCIHTEEAHPNTVISVKVTAEIAETDTHFILVCQYNGAASGRTWHTCEEQ